MKKIISIILSFVIVFSLAAPTFASAEKCNCGILPVVYVPGFGEAIYKYPATENEYSVFPPEEDAIKSAIPDILKAVGALLIARDYDGFGTYAIDAADKILSEAGCNPDGTAKENTGIDPCTLPSVDRHKTANYAFDNKDIDDESEFKYTYDWRLDPVDNAKGLYDYIKQVKEFTGHDEIVLASHSQGNTVVASYLHLYGSDGIEKIVFMSPAYQGLSLVGALLTRTCTVTDKEEAVAEFVMGIMGYEDITAQLVGAIISILNDCGVTGYLLDFVQKILDEQLDRVFDDYLIDVMGTMPGVWSFVPDEYYEDAKKATFRGLDKYDELEKKTDYYHYNVQCKITEIIDAAKKNGTVIASAFGYDISSIPVAAGKENHSDFLIDTKYMSLGATGAHMGETLGDNYKQKNTSCGHNHVSPDNIIDASTSAYPEHTWYIKGNPHNEFKVPYLKFLTWIILFDGQPTVTSNPDYPQFMEIKDGEMKAVDGAREKDGRSDIRIIIDSVIVLLKDSINK